MFIRSLLGKTTIALLILATAALPLAAEAGASDFHEEERFSTALTTLDQDIQRLLRRMAHDRATPRLDEEVELLRQRFQDLEAWSVSMDREGLDGKVRALGYLLGNVERAMESEDDSGLPNTQRFVEPVTALGGAPPNDICARALPLDGPVVGDLTNAGNDGHASCGASYDSPDVWYRWVAGEEETISLDTFGSSYDTVLSVHEGCPGSISNQVACNDDVYGLQSALTFDVVPGRTYWIRVSGGQGAVGTYNLRLGPGGGIEGRLTEVDGGANIAGVNVNFANVFGFFSGSATTDSNGVYQSAGLAAGLHFVTTDSPGHLDELYDDLPCEPSCDETDGVGVGVGSSEIVENIDFALERSGSFSGTVTEDDGGAPIPNLRVVGYSSSGGYIGQAFTQADGRYVFGGLPAGDYYAVVDTSLYVEELYDDIPCFLCDPTTGKRITVMDGALTPGIDFGLERLGVVRSTVTASLDGAPLEGIRVEVYNSSGFFRGTGLTDAAGQVEIRGLLAGNYYARTSSPRIVDELYDGLDCEDGCDVTTGTPIIVALDAVATADFAVVQKGRITGRVISAATGDPIPETYLIAWDEAGMSLDGVDADEDGYYELSGLPTGNIFITAEAPFGSHHIDELYDGFPCLNGSCDVTVGTPVAVAYDAPVGNLDVTLDRNGEVRGTITDISTGLPLGDVNVTFYDNSGSYAANINTDFEGQFVMPHLSLGDYFVEASKFAYTTQRYDGFVCLPSCQPTDGTLVSVNVNTTATVDMTLGHEGMIVGRLTDQATGLPLGGIRVVAYASNGFFAGSDTTDYSGAYEIQRLDADNYFVVTDEFQGSYQNEVHNNMPCSGCDPTTGTPVAVVMDTRTTVNFALDRLGTISGVLEDGDGQGIDGRVNFWSSGGSFEGAADTRNDGSYQQTLPSGQYYVTTQTTPYQDEVYNNIPCETSCDPTTGMLVSVSLGNDTSGIDFVLDKKGIIAGRLTDAMTGDPLANRRVDIWDSEGSSVTFALTDADGHYRSSGLVADSYYVTTATSSHADEIYSGLPCLPESCNPTTGMAIAIDLNVEVIGIDFVLEELGVIEGTVIAESSGSPRSFATIRIWDSEGELMGTTNTGDFGEYRYDRLYPGTYYVTVEDFGYVGELYNEIPCPSGTPSDCDPTEGQPILITGTNEVVTVDFALRSLFIGTRLEGAVFNGQYVPLEGVTVDVWNDSGVLVTSALTSGSGSYLATVEPGTYYLSTHNDLGYIDKVYLNISCPQGSAYEGACDPMEGQAVIVEDETVENLNFLILSPIFSDGFESGDTSAWSSGISP